MISSNKLQERLKAIEGKLIKIKNHQNLESVFIEQAQIRFEKNLEAFKEHFPNIASSIESFQPSSELAIHVTETGYGNIESSVSGMPLYGEDPLSQVQKQVDDAVNNPVFTLSDYSSHDPNSTDERLHIKYMHSLGRLLTEDRLKNSRKSLKSLPKHFPSAMIFGVGLGYHIPMLFEKSSFDFTFIIEPEFNNFYLSLFCIDWASVIEKVNDNSGCLFLFVGIKSEELVSELKKITDDVGAFSLVRSFCYQHIPLPEINAHIQEFFKEYFQFQFGHGFYNDAVTGLAHTYHHLKKNIPFYDAGTPVFDKQVTVPAIVVGNGPSLDEARSFLEKNQGRAIIFGCGTALTSLLRMGIKPDFHVLVERPYRNYQALSRIATEDDYAELNLLSINTVYPDTTDLYKWRGLSLKGNEAGTDFVHILNSLNKRALLRELNFCNPLVANTALAYAIAFGFQEIYLCGVDNGNLVCGKHHSELSLYDKNDKNEVHFHPQGSDGSELKGNLGGKVDSNPVYRVSNRQLEELMKLSPRTVYNIGNGAKISGAVPVESDMLLDLPPLNSAKSKIVDKIKSAFKPVNMEFLTEKDMNIEATMEVFDELIQTANESYKSVEDVADILKRQQRYIYAFRRTAFSHVFQLINGSLLYYHCPLVTNLYQYEEADALELYNKINALWVNYLIDMKAHFAKHAVVKCDWAF